MGIQQVATSLLLNKSWTMLNLVSFALRVYATCTRQMLKRFPFKNFFMIAKWDVTEGNKRKKIHVTYIRGRPSTTKWLLWMTSNHHILGFLSMLGLVFGHVCSVRGCLQFRQSWPYLLCHVTRTQKPNKLAQLVSFPNGTNAKGKSAFRSKVCCKDILNL